MSEHHPDLERFSLELRAELEKLPVELLERVNYNVMSSNLELCSRELHNKLNSDSTRRKLVRAAFRLDRFGTLTQDRLNNMATFRSDMSSIITRPWFYEGLPHQHAKGSPFMTRVELVAWASIRDSMTFLLNPPSWTQGHADFLAFIWHCIQVVPIVTNRRVCLDYLDAATKGLATAVKEGSLPAVYFLTGSIIVNKACFGPIPNYNRGYMLSLRARSLVDSTTRKSVSSIWQWRYLSTFVSQDSLKRHIYYWNLESKYLGWGSASWGVAQACDFHLPPVMNVLGSTIALLAILNNMKPEYLSSSSSTTAVYRGIINESMHRTRTHFPNPLRLAVNDIPRLAEVTTRILQLPNCDQYKPMLLAMIVNHLLPLFREYDFLHNLGRPYKSYVDAFDLMKGAVESQKTVDLAFYVKVAEWFPRKARLLDHVPSARRILRRVLDWSIYYARRAFGMPGA